MDETRFDTLTRTLTDGASRRMFVVGLATVLGLGAADYCSGVTIARKGKARHKKRPQSARTAARAAAARALFVAVRR